MNNKAKLITDISMTAVLPMLMAYSLIGEALHEVIGTLMLVLFIVHHIFNRKWIAASGRGRYNARRIFQTLLDLLLFVFMIAQPVSGILMSKHLYTFTHVLGASATSRKVHMVLAYWGFVLASVHAGTHLTGPMIRLKHRDRRSWSIFMTAVTLVSAYGCFAFFKRQLPDYMFMRTGFVFFDPGEPVAFFFGDYLAIMVLFAAAGGIAAWQLSRHDIMKSKEDINRDNTKG